LFEVLTAVQFDDQAALGAAEVGDERTDRVLAAEFYSELISSEPRSQLFLCVGWLVARSRVSLVEAIVRRIRNLRVFRSDPHPHPLPYPGEGLRKAFATGTL
jgi:hypothetical protein